MTKAEMIEILTDPAKQIPDDAVLLAFDPEEQRVMPLTGMVYGADYGGSYSVELCTDPLDD